jgi:hypothetical protein
MFVSFTCPETFREKRYSVICKRTKKMCHEKSSRGTKNHHFLHRWQKVVFSEILYARVEHLDIRPRYYSIFLDIFINMYIHNGNI